MITNDQYTRSYHVRTTSYFWQSLAELHNVDILMYSVSLRNDMYSKYGVSFEGTHEAWEIPSSDTMKSGRLYWECPEYLWSCESRVKDTGSSWVSGKKSLLLTFQIFPVADHHS